MMYVYGLDVWWLKALNSLGSEPAIAAFFRFASAIGENAYIWIAIALFVMATGRRGAVKLALIAVLAVIFTQVGTDIIKLVVARPRPFTVIPEIIRYGNLESTFAFPSAHASRSFAAAVVLSAGLTRWRLLWYALAGVIALSRVVLGAHFPTDVIVGALLGCAVGLAFVHLLGVDVISEQAERAGEGSAT